MLCVILSKFLPEREFPGIEVVLGFIALRVSLAIAENTGGSQLLKSVIKKPAHLVEELVGAVTQSKHQEVNALEDLRISLILLGIAEPFVGFLEVVTWVTLVMSGHHEYN